MWIAAKHHRTHKNKPLTFSDRPFLVNLYMDNSDYLVIMKSTQCGVSEMLMCRSFAAALQGRGIFYVLPTFVLASRFVKNRIDRTAAFSHFYKAVMRTGLRTASESMMLKHFAEGSVAFVGSNTPTVFTEFPADDLIIDELDFCDQDNIKMGWERLSASEDKAEIRVSNPTVEGYGIDEEYANTTQDEWHLVCACGRKVRPDFFEHVVREVGPGAYVLRDDSWERGSRDDVGIVCPKCGRALDRKGDGVWIASYPGRTKRGYRISKLFSTNVTVAEMVDRFNKGLVNDSDMQRFYNADLGLPYTAEGAKITEQMLDELVRDYPRGIPESRRPCLMGVDVGKFLTVTIGQVEEDGGIRIVYIGEVDDEADVLELYQRYRCRAGTIDALPETRMSKRLTRRIRGMFSVFYGDTKKDSLDAHNKIVTVERTQHLDDVKEWVVSGMLALPRDARSVPQFYEQMTAATRVWDEKRARYFWTEGSRRDHFHHAVGYMLLAKRLLVMLANR